MAGGLHYKSLADLPPGIRQQVAGKVAARAAAAVAGRRESKYHNEPVTVKGIRFDSKKEARRYLQLIDALRESLISDLRLQQDFTLQEAYTTPEGQRIRAIRYKADFTYKIEWAGEFMPTGVPLDDLECWRRLGRGAMVVEDTKSAPTKTPQYRMKYKMMADKGYIIREATQRMSAARFAAAWSMSIRWDVLRCWNLRVSGETSEKATSRKI